MTDLRNQIFAELDILDAAAAKLRTSAAGASRQTDLEVAILSQQVSDLREKNIRAKKLVVDTISILSKLKGTKK